MRDSLGGKVTYMPTTILATLLLSLALPAQDSLSLHATRIGDSTLVEVLNWAEKQDLNKLPGGSHTDLALRLYAVGHSGTCVEETEWVCTYHYVLAVSEHGEEPAQAAFDLGEVGQIGNIRWLSSPDQFHAILRVGVRNYPLHAVRQNPKLKLRSRSYKMDISVQTLTLTPLQ